MECYNEGGYMGEKDLSTKFLESYNDVFADIFNVLLFHNNYVEETLLVDGPTETQYKAENENIIPHHRDCLKYYKNTKLACITLGIENQVVIDKTMPVRIMGYDCERYATQLRNKKEVDPIVSIVLYFGNRKWNKPLSLFDMIKNIPDEIKPFVNNYPIHVIDVKRIPKRIRQQLKSDFKVIADFFADKDKKDYYPSNDMITHPEATLHMLRVFTGDSRYDDIMESIQIDTQKGKVITMCDFAERMERQGIEKGIQEGIIKGETLITDAILALKSGKTVEELKDIYNEHTLTLAQKCI